MECEKYVSALFLNVFVFIQAGVGGVNAGAGFISRDITLRCKATSLFLTLGAPRICICV